MLGELDPALECSVSLKQGPFPLLQLPRTPSAQSGWSPDSVSTTSTLPVTDKLEKEKQNEEYDPFAHREVERPVSDLGALMHLLKSSLGSGILAMPMAFHSAGLATGLVGTALVGYICTHCVHMLVECSQRLCRRLKVPSLDYPATAGAAFTTGPERLRPLAPVARWFVCAGLVATYYSVITIYIIFIAATLKQVGDYHSTSEATRFDVRIYTAMLAPLVLAKGQLRHLKTLVPFSMLANLCIVTGFAATLYYLFVDLPPLEDRRLVPASITALPVFLTTTIYAMEGVGAVMPVENNMRNPRHFSGCPGVVNIAMTLMCTLYCVVGFFGYYKYGEDTLGSITLNLPVDDAGAGGEAGGGGVLLPVVRSAAVHRGGHRLEAAGRSHRPRLPRRGREALQGGARARHSGAGRGDPQPGPGHLAGGRGVLLYAGPALPGGHRVHSAVAGAGRARLVALEAPQERPAGHSGLPGAGHRHHIQHHRHHPELWHPVVWPTGYLSLAPLPASLTSSTTILYSSLAYWATAVSVTSYRYSITDIFQTYSVQ